MSVEDAGEIAYIDGIDVPRQQPLRGVLDGSVAGVVALPPAFVVEAFDSTATVPIVGKLGLQLGDAFGQASESIELRSGVIHRGFTVVGDDGEGVVRADIDGRRLSRVLGVECVSEAIPSLFPEVGWLYRTGWVTRIRSVASS